MKRNATAILFSVLIGLPALTSCKKEGCTDEKAENFVFKAKKDDGSCQYQASVILWYGMQSSIDMTDNGIDSLHVYIDSVELATISPTRYWPIQPACGENKTLTFQRDLGSSPVEPAFYHVNDQNGNTLWSGPISFIGGECTAQELKY